MAWGAIDFVCPKCHAAIGALCTRPVRDGARFTEEFCAERIPQATNPSHPTLGRKCDGPGCKIVMPEVEANMGSAFCSIECAVYAKKFDVNKGWLESIDSKSK